MRTKTRRKKCKYSKCGQLFHGKYREQECCSIECSVELRKERGWFHKSPEFYASRKGSVSRIFNRERKHGIIRNGLQSEENGHNGMSWRGIYSAKQVSLMLKEKER